jgi:glycosyltransferase involved in cell wall biosynthesis
MVKLSIYTFVKDGLYYDFHIVDMLKHHIPLADEIIVNEGFSSDGTYEAIKDLDPKIKVHRFEWDRSDPSKWHMRFKNQARELCTGDWCILLDCDEFIPEWEFERLRRYLSTTDKLIVPIRFTHFYGNYRVYIATPSQITPELGMRIHRNRPDAEVWGDGANVRIRGQKYGPEIVTNEAFACHHFGCVRNPARLRQKWRTQAKQHKEDHPKWDRLPSFLFDLLPHRWNDKDILDRLSIYEGPHIKAVRDNPSEFIRDDFLLIKMLSTKGCVEAADSK